MINKKTASYFCNRCLTKIHFYITHGMILTTPMAYMPWLWQYQMGHFDPKFIIIQFWSVWESNWIYYLQKMVHSMFQPISYFRLDFPAYILSQSHWLLINAVAYEMRCSNFVFVRRLCFSSYICWHFIGWDRKFRHFCLCRFGVLYIILRSIGIW